LPSAILSRIQQRRRPSSPTTASCQNIDIHSLASARSCSEPPRSSDLPFRYRINFASPHEAMTSPSSLNSGKNFIFMTGLSHGGLDKYGRTLKKLWRGKGARSKTRQLREQARPIQMLSRLRARMCLDVRGYLWYEMDSGTAMVAGLGRELWITRIDVMCYRLTKWM